MSPSNVAVGVTRGWRPVEQFTRWVTSTHRAADHARSGWQDRGMAALITEPTTVPAAGEPPKLINEFVGRVNSGTSTVSVAVMDSPSGWVEPGQRPDFDEYTLVLDGELLVESEGGRSMTVPPGRPSTSRPASGSATPPPAPTGPATSPSASPPSAPTSSTATSRRRRASSPPPVVPRWAGPMDHPAADDRLRRWT